VLNPYQAYRPPAAKVEAPPAAAQRPDFAVDPAVTHFCLFTASPAWLLSYRFSIEFDLHQRH
jgi:hypothetical protein